MNSKYASSQTAQNVGIARAFVRYHSGMERKRGSRDFNLVARLDDLATSDPLRAIMIMDAIVERTDCDSIFADMGAGPLERLLSEANEPELADRVMQRARQNSHWRLALGCVWTTHFIDRQLADKVESLILQFFPDGRP